MDQKLNELFEKIKSGTLTVQEAQADWNKLKMTGQPGRARESRGDSVHTGPMPSPQELKSLIEAFGETCQFISELRARCPIARYVQYPKIPTILSESLAVHAILQGRLLASTGPFSSVIRGGRKADVLAVLMDGQELRIETKASGEEDFATFGKKDYAAHFLLWLRFGKSLRESCLGQMEVLVCPRPAEHLPWARDRANVAQLLAAWDGEIGRVQLDLRDLLAPQPPMLDDLVRGVIHDKRPGESDSGSATSKDTW
jgi:hypothetical protein